MSRDYAKMSLAKLFAQGEGDRPRYAEYTAASLRELAEDCADMDAAGTDILADDHPLATELENLPAVNRRALEWYVLGAAYGRRQHLAKEPAKLAIQPPCIRRTVDAEPGGLGFWDWIALIVILGSLATFAWNYAMPGVDLGPPEANHAVR